MTPRSHTGGAVVGASMFRLPPPRHHSSHQVAFDGVALGSYTMSIYSGHSGPVVVLEEGPASDLPIEFLSLLVTEQLLDVLRDRSLRVFERHRRRHRELWVEVEISERHGREVHIARTGETGADKLIDALGTAAFQDAIAVRRRDLEDQERT